MKFKSQVGLGHSWKSEDMVEFLEKLLNYTAKSQPNPPNQLGLSFTQKLVIAGGILGIGIFLLTLIRPKKKRPK